MQTKPTSLLQPLVFWFHLFGAMLCEPLCHFSLTLPFSSDPWFSNTVLFHINPLSSPSSHLLTTPRFLIIWFTRYCVVQTPLYPLPLYRISFCKNPALPSPPLQHATSGFVMRSIACLIILASLWYPSPLPSFNNPWFSNTVYWASCCYRGENLELV